jgi:two-component system phosphate regulon response regulator PhoB
LIVEDDADLRRMFRQLLQFAGFEVEEASDGWRALQLIDQRLPDLVVLDLTLPAVSGFVVQQDIAARAHSRHIPIVIVTGSTEDLDQLEVACVLRKPVSPDKLVETVRSCLASGAPSVGG